jgi:hypothetical protein
MRVRRTFAHNKENLNISIPINIIETRKGDFKVSCDTFGLESYAKSKDVAVGRMIEVVKHQIKKMRRKNEPGNNKAARSMG